MKVFGRSGKMPPLSAHQLVLPSWAPAVPQHVLEWWHKTPGTLLILGLETVSVLGRICLASTSSPLWDSVLLFPCRSEATGSENQLCLCHQRLGLHWRCAGSQGDVQVHSLVFSLGFVIMQAPNRSHRVLLHIKGSHLSHELQPHT